jgi:RNA polymerase sigma-70 factor, ECF subfamily
MIRTDLPRDLVRSRPQLRAASRPARGEPNLLAAGPSPELLDRLYRAAWALCGSGHDAEDLVQETFARVLARPRRLRRSDPAPYLIRTLRNTYLSGLRTAGRRPRTSGLPGDESALMLSRHAHPDVSIEQREALTAIAALPDEFRLPLVAVDIVGLSHREVARALRIREPTVATRLFRARRRIAIALDGDAAEA